LKWKVVGTVLGVALLALALLVSPLTIRLGTDSQYSISITVPLLIAPKSTNSTTFQNLPSDADVETFLVGNGSLTVNQPLRLTFFLDLLTAASQLFAPSAVYFSLNHGYAYPIEGSPKLANLSLSIVNRTQGHTVWGGYGLVEYLSSANMSGKLYLQGTNIQSDRFETLPPQEVNDPTTIQTANFSNSGVLIGWVYFVLLFIPAAVLLVFSFWPRRRSRYGQRPRRRP
jgi:hypothetical protein